MMQQRIPLTIIWGVIGIFLIADLILLSISRLSFTTPNVGDVLWTSLIVVGLFAVEPLTRYRLGSDKSKAARHIVNCASGVGLLAHAIAFIVALGLVGVAYSYLSTSLALPLWDGDLAAIDRGLGFDWPAFLAWTNGTSPIAVVLQFAYHTTGPQLIAVVLLLCFARKPKRLSEFLAILAVSSLLTAIGMTLVPAEGTYAHYAPPLAFFSNYSAESGMWHHETLVALRTQAKPVLDFATTQGLVTFPSFHTILAIITTYAVRDWRWLLAAVLILNGTVIVGTITEGGHHLIDIIAGALIAGVSIAFVRAAMANQARPAIGTATQKSLA